MRRVTPVFLFVCFFVLCACVCMLVLSFSWNLFYQIFFLVFGKTRMYWTILMKLEKAGCCCCMWDLLVPQPTPHQPLPDLEKLHIFTFILVKIKQNKVDNSFHLCSAASLSRDALYPFQTKWVLLSRKICSIFENPSSQWHFPVLSLWWSSNLPSCTSTWFFKGFNWILKSCRAIDRHLTYCE